MLLVVVLAFEIRVSFEIQEAFEMTQMAFLMFFEMTQMAFLMALEMTQMAFEILVVFYWAVVDLVFCNINQ